jgi:hypothetical protein
MISEKRSFYLTGQNLLHKTHVLIENGESCEGFDLIVMYTAFDEQRFNQKVTAAVEAIKKVLENTKRPTFPSNVSHHYVCSYLIMPTEL